MEFEIRTASRPTGKSQFVVANTVSRKVVAGPFNKLAEAEIALTRAIAATSPEGF